MVVFIPIMFGAPAMLVFIPPAMPLAPAALSRLVQFTALVIGLAAVASMTLDGFMQFMLGVLDAALTAINIFGVKSRYRAEENGCGEDRAGKDLCGCACKLATRNHKLSLLTLLGCFASQQKVDSS